MTVQGRNETRGPGSPIYEEILRVIDCPDVYGHNEAIYVGVERLLAAEHRATVERIREQVHALETTESQVGTMQSTFVGLAAILDEEAAR